MDSWQPFSVTATVEPGSFRKAKHTEKKWLSLATGLTESWAINYVRTLEFTLSEWVQAHYISWRNKAHGKKTELLNRTDSKSANREIALAKFRLGGAVKQLEISVRFGSQIVA